MLSVGSIAWAIWALVVTQFSPNIAKEYNILFDAFPIFGWAFLFLLHGIVGIIALLLKQSNRSLIIIGSMYGAALWTVSLNLVILSHLADGTFPMGSAHWMMSTVAWWILFRDCFGETGE